jgi:glycosyltransferase involved in cell wall biosynthesis
VAYFTSLSTFFPMWNEEQTIDRAVRAATELSEKLVALDEIDDYEIVIVDDASTDTTPERADRLAELDPHVRVVHHSVNRKLGGSLKTGFSEAKSELVLYTDADLPFDMGEVVKAVRLLRLYQADVVSAYRFDRTGEGVVRLVYSYAYNHLVRWLFGLRVRDVNFAFKLMHRRVLDDVLPLKSEGSFIDVELLVRARRRGFEIIQFGVDYFPRSRGVSTLSSGSVIAKLVSEMLALRPELNAVQPRSHDEG